MRILSESELILNTDGSVYHLHLTAGEIAPYIITVGDPERVGMVSKHFEHIATKKANREFVTHTGFYKSKPITVISTGIGTDNIDIVMTELDAAVNIDLERRLPHKEKRVLEIVRIGTSGSLHADLQLNEVVASAYGLGFDNLMHYYNHKTREKDAVLLKQIMKHLGAKKAGLQPYMTAASFQLLQKLAIGYRWGITATCSGFYGPQGRALRIKPRHPDLLADLGSFISKTGAWQITNFEMETAGLLGMARLLGHKALSLNVVVANRVDQTFSADYQPVLESVILNVLDSF